MAHVLLADDNLITQELLRDVLEMDGHTVTSVGNGWDALIVMRATLHPLVVVFDDWTFDSRRSGDGPDQEVPRQALARHVSDLQRHRFIELRVLQFQRPPEEQALYDQLAVVTMWMPFDLEKLYKLVDEAARQLVP